jgi:hypothetical protein
MPRSSEISSLGEFRVHGRTLTEIKETGAAWIAESELARLVAIVEIVKARRGRFTSDADRSLEEKALDALLETFDA